jgi:hypothetical protein
MFSFCSNSHDAESQWERSSRDRRSVRIKATKKGNDLCKSLAEMEARHAEALSPDAERIEGAWALLRGLERVWSEDIRFG